MCIRDRTGNDQRLSEIVDSQEPTIAYAQMDANTQRPISYRQLAPQRDHYNIDDNPPDNNAVGPYERLNISSQQIPAVYEQLESYT